MMCRGILVSLAWILVTGTTGADHPRPGSVEQPKPAQIDTAISRGIDFLLKDQNSNGSWGGPTRTKGLNIYAPVPGAHHAFQAAVTAMCVSALIETAGDDPKVAKAIRRGEDFLLEFLPRVRRATSDALYNVWTHAYAIQALVRMHGRAAGDATRQDQIRLRIEEQIGMLDRYASVDGGWGYYDFRAGTKRPASSSTSFTNGAALVALHEAKELGIEIPEKMLKAALDATVRQRKPDFSYLYGEYLKWQPMHPVNRPAGSLGRSQCCNIALRLWGDETITDAVIAEWLDRLFARNGWLDNGRKRPIPHEAPFAVAGYFFYFGHYYAALCIEQLKPDERAFYQDHLATVLLRIQEDDGSWWDYPFYNYHQQYGTAFALMTLKRCRR